QGYILLVIAFAASIRTHDREAISPFRQFREGPAKPHAGQSGAHFSRATANGRGDVELWIERLDLRGASLQKQEDDRLIGLDPPPSGSSPGGAGSPPPEAGARQAAQRQAPNAQQLAPGRHTPPRRATRVDDREHGRNPLVGPRGENTRSGHSEPK